MNDINSVPRGVGEVQFTSTEVPLPAHGESESEVDMLNPPEQYSVPHPAGGDPAAAAADAEMDDEINADQIHIHTPLTAGDKAAGRVASMGAVASFLTFVAVGSNPVGIGILVGGILGSVILGVIIKATANVYAGTPKPQTPNSDDQVRANPQHRNDFDSSNDIPPGTGGTTSTQTKPKTDDETGRPPNPVGTLQPRRPRDSMDGGRRNEEH